MCVCVPVPVPVPVPVRVVLVLVLVPVLVLVLVLVRVRVLVLVLVLVLVRVRMHVHVACMSVMEKCIGKQSHPNMCVCVYVYLYTYMSCMYACFHLHFFRRHAPLSRPRVILSMMSKPSKAAVHTRSTRSLRVSHKEA